MWGFIGAPYALVSGGQCLKHSVHDILLANMAGHLWGIQDSKQARYGDVYEMSYWRTASYNRRLMGGYQNFDKCYGSQVYGKRAASITKDHLVSYRYTAHMTRASGIVVHFHADILHPHWTAEQCRGHENKDLIVRWSCVRCSNWCTLFICGYPAQAWIPGQLPCAYTVWSIHKYINYTCIHTYTCM